MDGAGTVGPALGLRAPRADAILPRVKPTPPRLRRLLLVLTIATWLLVGVGALVRAAGAGLGCPDWPLCFGKLLPPTSLDQVPDQGNWRELFNLRLAWIEYVNRLYGIVVGLIAIVATWKTWRLGNTRLVSTVTLMMVLFVAQGFLGGQVVREHLDAFAVTVHFLAALVILCVQLHANVLSQRHRLVPRSPPSPARRTALWAVRAVAVLVVAQVVLGTLVRGAIDTIGEGDTVDAIASGLPRAEWLARIEHLDIPHRQLGALTFVTVVAAMVLVARRAESGETWLRRAAVVAAATAAGQIAVGLVLTYLGFPAWAMVAHLVLGSTLVCALFVVHQLLAREQLAAEADDQRRSSPTSVIHARTAATDASSTT